MAQGRSTPLHLPLLGATRERRDAAANRQRILRAARRIVRERGADGLSMDAVAAAAGVGKGTVFRRFGDRAGLTEALVDEYMRDFQDGFLLGPPPLGPGAPPADRLRAFVVALVALQHENLQLALAAEPRDPRRGAGAVGALLVHVHTLVQELNPRLDAQVTATLILGAISPPVLNQLRDAPLDAVETAVTALLDGVTRGTAT